MVQVIYSAQKNGFVKGRIYLNPRFFTEVLHRGATSVVVVGNWPTVVKCYEDAGIEVIQLKPGDPLPGEYFGDIDPYAQQPPHNTKKADDKPPIEIPDDYENLSYRDLRALVLSIDPAADINSKKSAVEFLQIYQAG